MRARSETIIEAGPSQAPIELKNCHSERDPSSHEHPETSFVAVEDSNPPSTPLPYLKLFSSAFSFFVAGTNDGSIGALIPYMLESYSIKSSLIAVLYFTTFAGWLVAAATNSHLPKFLQLGAILAIGAFLQLSAQVLRPWEPPFGLFVVTFFLSGLGQAYQDSYANTFVSTVKGAHRWLAFIHASYGLGLLVAPFVATAIASHYSSRWALFYLFPLGLSVMNLCLVFVSFRESLHRVSRSISAGSGLEEETGRNKNAMNEVRQMFRMKNLWIMSLFYFFYLGAMTTSGGWIVEFLVKVRDGNLKEVGYVPAGAYGGVCLGRLLLAEPTHRYGERKMLLIYSVISLVLQLVFWLVPNMVSSIVVFSIMGFFLGPFFAAGISVSSKLFPGDIQAAALGMIFVVAQAGGTLFPSLIGVIASKAGVHVLPPIVAALIVAMGITLAFVPSIPKSSTE